MTEYMISLIASCLLVSVASFVSYGEVKRGVTKFALGVILLASLISPLTGIIDTVTSSLSEIGEIKYKDDGSFSEYTEEYFCKGIKAAVADKFSLNEGDISVIAIRFSPDSMSAELIKITLSGAATSADYRAIRAYIEENNLGKCEVEISFDG